MSSTSSSLRGFLQTDGSNTTARLTVLLNLKRKEEKEKEKKEKEKEKGKQLVQ